MTLVLRDSLGGNCKTVMVATISGEAGQMEESISTCRFAQRVALVTNEVCTPPISAHMAQCCCIDIQQSLQHSRTCTDADAACQLPCGLPARRLAEACVCVAVLQVYVNESVDPSIIIARLKQEVRDLKEEIALLKGSTPQRGPLTPDELLRLRQQLLAYVDDPQAGAAAAGDGGGAANGSSAGLNFGGDMMMIRASE